MTKKIGVLDTDAVTFTFYEDSIISTPKEGAVFRRRHFQAGFDRASELYTTPFVLIADRVAHSSLDLAVYPFGLKACSGGLLKGLGIVAYRDITRIVAETERALSGKLPFKVFDTLDDAKLWVRKILD